jgi:hypothetical protein
MSLWEDAISLWPGVASTVLDTSVRPSAVTMGIMYDVAIVGDLASWAVIRHSPFHSAVLRTEEF